MDNIERHRREAGSANSTGGQFGVGKRGEADLSLDAEPVDQREAQANALSELADTLVRGTPFIDDDVEAAHRIVPNVPEHLLSNQLWHDVLSATLARDTDARDRALDTLVDYDAREARWRGDPTFVSPTGEATDAGGSGPVHYTTVTGSKYTGWRDVTEVAKDVRSDLKKAAAAGYLPDGLQYGVSVDKFAGGQALRVSVRGMTDKDIYREDPLSWGGGQMHSPTTAEMAQRVEAIAGAYGRGTSEIQTDFYQVMYWSTVNVEDEQAASWRRDEAADAKRKREIRKGASA